MLQCLLCSLAPPPAKVSGSHQNTSDYAGTANYAETAKWAQLDLQSIQHRDYFGHLSIFNICKVHCDSSLLAIRQIKLTMHFAMLNMLAGTTSNGDMLLQT